MALRVSGCRHVLAAALVLGGGVACRAQAAMEFTCDKTAPGRVALTAASRFGNGGGFDLLPSPTTVAKGACASDAPFFFSVAVPEGNYQVTVVLGSGERSTTTVRAESRRLFVERKTVDSGGSATEVFNVNVRTENIAGMPGAKVKLKPREIGALDWDDKLTLEFNGQHPSFRSIKVRPVTGLPVIYLAGDSTVVDQDKEPWAAWGQMLPAFFGPGVVIANEAESGETIRSFTSEGRFDKIMSTIRPGDYLMIQFAHNDQKGGTPEAMDFHGSLKTYVEAAQAHGAHPILVTAMYRRVFDPDGKIKDTLGGYPQAMRAFAAEAGVPLIDLNAMSKTLFEALGPEGTLKAFVHYPAHTFPGQDTELKDDTHFTAYGAYELARAVVQCIRNAKLPLAAQLKPGVAAFDPSRPDPVDAVVLPRSPLLSLEKPYGK